MGPTVTRYLPMVKLANLNRKVLVFAEPGHIALSLDLFTLQVLSSVKTMQGWGFVYLPSQKVQGWSFMYFYTRKMLHHPAASLSE